MKKHINVLLDRAARLGVRHQFIVGFVGGDRKNAERVLAGQKGLSPLTMGTYTNALLAGAVPYAQMDEHQKQLARFLFIDLIAAYLEDELERRHKPKR